MFDPEAGIARKEKASHRFFALNSHLPRARSFHHDGGENKTAKGASADIGGGANVTLSTNKVWQFWQPEAHQVPPLGCPAFTISIPGSLVCGRPLDRTRLACPASGDAAEHPSGHGKPPLNLPTFIRNDTS